MDTGVIVTLPGEEDDLALHVKVCEQRYAHLIHQLNNVDDGLTLVTKTLEEIKNNLHVEKNDDYKQHMHWALTIIIALGGWIFHLLSK